MLVHIGNFDFMQTHTYLPSRTFWFGLATHAGDSDNEHSFCDLLMSVSFCDKLVAQWLGCWIHDREVASSTPVCSATK